MGQTQHAGWRSRGYLPHCDFAGAVQHVIFCLADALPPAPVTARDESAEERAARIEAELDAGHGERLLGGGVAAQVQDALKHDDGIAYDLIAWCVMPTHVHVVIEQFPGHALSDTVQAWKSVSAHKINRLLGRKGVLWQREYYDRFMREDDDPRSVIDYVENNPVKAGLVALAEDWPYSSAAHAGEGAGAT